MGGFVVGDVVVVPFPFSDLSTSKRRPAVVLRDLPGRDLILCAVTKVKPDDSEPQVVLTTGSFASGALIIDPSYARPTKLFTADSGIIIKKVGTLKDSVVDDIRKKAGALF